MQGKLPHTYHINMCSSADSPDPCPFGRACEHAHSPAQVRVDAAIAQGQLPPVYKTERCSDLLEAGALCMLPVSVRMPFPAHPPCPPPAIMCWVRAGNKPVVGSAITIGPSS